MNSYLIHDSIENLESININDIFGNGSKVKLKEGDIALIIADDGVIFLIAVDEILAGDTGSSVIDIPSSTLAWVYCAKINNDVSSLPVGKLSRFMNDVIPAGYRLLASVGVPEYLIKNLSSGNPLVNPAIGLKNNTLFACDESLSAPLNRYYRIDVDNPKDGSSYSGLANLTGVCPYALNDPIGCVCGDYFYIFNCPSNAAYRYNFTTDAFSTIATPIPGTPKNGVVSFCIGTDIYMVGGKDTAEVDHVYKYNTLTDTYSIMNVTGYPFWKGGAAVVNDDLVYILYNDGIDKIKCLKYIPSTDTWTYGFIPDYTFTDWIECYHNVYYDENRGEVGVISQEELYTVIGFDIQILLWGVLVETKQNMNNDGLSTVFDKNRDRFIHTHTGWPYVSTMQRERNSLIVKE